MELDFKKGGGMLPAVVQEAGTGKVLMLGYMNPEAYRKTLESGNVTFFSRSQNKLWMKGESSGHVLKVKEVLVDCDLDSLVVANGNGNGNGDGNGNGNGNGNGTHTVRLPVSKTLVAARLGITKETLSRLLRSLAERRLIEVSQREIAILDRAALSEMAR